MTALARRVVCTLAGAWLGTVVLASDRPVPVIDDSGRPIEGAVLRDAAAGAAGAPLSTSDARGMLRVPREPKGDGSFRVDRAGHLTANLSGKNLRELEGVVLVRAASLSGTVRDTVSGKPVKDVRVEISGNAAQRKPVEVISDAAGRFDVRDLAPGLVRVRARVAGSLVTVIDESLSPGASSTLNVPIARLAEVTVAPGPVASDKPLAGVRAEIRSGRGYPQGVEFHPAEEAGAARTGAVPVLPQTRESANPAVEIRFSVPAGVPIEVRFRATGYAPVARAFVAKTAAETVAIPLRVGTSVVGRIVDEEGRAVTGVPLRARYVDPTQAELLDWAAAKPAPSGDDGSFRLASLFPGALTLETVESDWALSRMSPIRVDTTDVDLGKIVAHGAGAILGRVVRKSTGHGVDGAAIRGCLLDLGCAWTASAKSDKTGAFRLTGVSGGSWTVEATHSGSPAARVEGLVPGSGAVLLEIPDGGGLTGRASGPDGSPLARVRLVVTAPHRADRVAFEQSVETTEGRFDVASAPPGRWTVLLRAPGYGPVRLDSVEVRDGQPTDLGEILFFPGRVARGRVVTNDDAPVVGASVTVRGERGADSPSDVSRADGSFELNGLPDTSFALIVTAAGFAPAVESYGSGGPEEGLELPERTVRLSAGGAVEGQVRGEDDAPVGGARIRLPSYQEVDAAVTDLTGKYRIEHVPTGDVSIQMIADPAAPEAWTETRRVAIADGGVARVDFVASGSVEGIVRRRGQPLGFARISAVASGGTALVHTTESDADGMFRLHGLSEGTWTLHVVGGGCQARFPLVRAAGDGERRVELDVPPDDLTGWILDDSNAGPLASAEVSWSDAAAPPDIVTYRLPVPSSLGGSVVLESRPMAGATARTLSDGSFHLCIPAAGQLEVEAFAGSEYEEGYATVVLPAREPVTIRLRPKGDEVRIVVRRPDGGRASSSAAVALVHQNGFYELVPVGAGGEAKLTRPETSFRVWAGIPRVGIGSSEWVPEDADLSEPLEVAVAPGGYLSVRGAAALREQAQAAGSELELRLVADERDDVFLWTDVLGVLETRVDEATGDELMGPFPMGRFVLQAFIGAEPMSSKEVEISANPTSVDLAPARE